MVKMVVFDLDGTLVNSLVDLGIAPMRDLSRQACLYILWRNTIIL